MGFVSGFFGFFGALIPRSRANGAPQTPTLAGAAVPSIDYEKYNAQQNAEQAALRGSQNAQAINTVKSIPVVGAPLAVIGAALTSLQPAPSHPFPPPDQNYDPYDYVFYYAHEGAVLGFLDMRGIGPKDPGYVTGMPVPENPLNGPRASGLLKDDAGRNVEGKFWFNACRHDLLLRQAGGEKLSARQAFFMDHNPHDLFLEIAPALETAIVQPPNVNGTDLLGNPPKSDPRTYREIIGAGAATLAKSISTSIAGLQASTNPIIRNVQAPLVAKLQAQLAVLQPYLT